MKTDSLFNAFIMPYNMEENYFKLNSFVGNIGEAIGDWRYNKNRMSEFRVLLWTPDILCITIQENR